MADRARFHCKASWSVAAPWRGSLANFLFLAALGPPDKVRRRGNPSLRVSTRPSRLSWSAARLCGCVVWGVEIRDRSRLRVSSWQWVGLTSHPSFSGFDFKKLIQGPLYVGGSEKQSGAELPVRYPLLVAQSHERLEAEPAFFAREENLQCLFRRVIAVHKRTAGNRLVGFGEFTFWSPCHGSKVLPGA